MLGCRPRFDLRPCYGYSFPSCPSLLGQLVRAPESVVSDGVSTAGRWTGIKDQHPNKDNTPVRVDLMRNGAVSRATRPTAGVGQAHRGLPDMTR
jgi:hypothetical protein